MILRILLFLLCADGSLPLPDRSVYDGEEHSTFMEKLEARIRNHDREIEKMCNFHYQGFVDSITELLKVRGEAEKLKVGLPGSAFYMFRDFKDEFQV